MLLGEESSLEISPRVHAVVPHRMWKTGMRCCIFACSVGPSVGADGTGTLARLMCLWPGSETSRYRHRSSHAHRRWHSSIGT
jgi:hypothetical protein